MNRSLNVTSGRHYLTAPGAAAGTEGELLRTARREAGFDVTAAARLLRITVGELVALETGTRTFVNHFAWTDAVAYFKAAAARTRKAAVR